MRRVSIASAALCGAVVVAAPTSVYASAFAIRDTSAESVGMVTAGNGSRADDLDTIFNNPAGMTYFDGNQVEFGLLAIHTDIDFHGSDTLGGMPITGLQGNAGRFGGLPNLYAMYSISDRLKLGLAVTAPFGLLVKYNQPWIGRYLANEGSIVTLDVNPNIAYRVFDWLSVGGGVSAQYLAGVLGTSVNQAAILGVPGLPDANARFDGTDWAFGFNFGILAEPLPGTKIGVTYRSKVAHQQHGNFEYSDVNPVLGAGGLGILVDNHNANEDFSLPASIGLSLTQAINPVLSVSADLVRTQWGTLQAINIVDGSTGIPVAPPLQSGFRDTWSVAVGANYRWSDRLTLRGGFGYDESPVTNGFRSAFLPDQSRFTLGIGASYKLTEATTAEFGYAHFFAVGNTPITGSVNAVDKVTGSALTGNYDVSLDALAATVRVKF